MAWDDKLFYLNATGKLLRHAFYAMNKVWIDKAFGSSRDKRPMNDVCAMSTRAFGAFDDRCLTIFEHAKDALLAVFVGAAI